MRYSGMNKREANDVDAPLAATPTWSHRSETHPTNSHGLHFTKKERRQGSKGVEGNKTDSQILVADVTVLLFFSFQGKNEAVCSQNSP